MPSDTLPNGVISNLAMVPVISLTTVVAIRLKSRLCDTYQRMPRQYIIDRYMSIISNLLAYSLLVIWATYLPGDQKSRLELLVVMDLLMGIHVQRYTLLLIHSEDTSPYHEPGPLALLRRTRRTKLALILVTLTCAWCAATSVAVAYKTTSPYSHYSDGAEYSFLILALPAIHAALRTIVMDTQGCRRPTSVHETLNEDMPTNNFTITDDEEDATLQDDAL